MMRSTALLFVVLLSGGCGILSSTCDLGQRPAVSIMVVDSATSGLVEADVVTVTVSDGQYVDSRSIAGADSHNDINLAPERPGTYRAEVMAEGYETWIREGITVVAGDCHVQTAEVTARLRSR